MDSVWQQTVKLPHFDPLQKDIKTDVLVIGGGMAGILCGYFLKQAGIRCVIAEANRICSGTTGHTTAKITIQHGLIYNKLLRTFGLDGARLYLKANQEALERYHVLCQSIDCDFQRRDSYVYSLQNRQKIEAEQKALTQIGYSATFTNLLPLPFPVAGAVCVKQQAQFHPLKFAAAIAKELDVLEHTMVTALYPGGAVTNHGNIAADKIIVTTHFPFLNTHGSYFLKLYQHRSYLLGVKQTPELEGIYVDEDKKGMTFRNAGDLLLVGGGGHRTGKKGGGWQEPETLVKRYYPQSKITYRWAAQDCMSLDSVPYIGLYSSHTPNLYVATGFNKWGMTSAMVAATLLTDLIKGKENSYAKLFSPSRSILRPQLAANAFETTVNLLTPTTPRCPHLGCALKYNPAEHSWDCPCHGSRFTVDGKLIDNPATGDLKRPVR